MITTQIPSLGALRQCRASAIIVSTSRSSTSNLWEFRFEQRPLNGPNGRTAADVEKEEYSVLGY